MVKGFLRLVKELKGGGSLQVHVVTFGLVRLQLLVGVVTPEP